jgi:hypothetical protein
LKKGLCDTVRKSNPQKRQTREIEPRARTRSRLSGPKGKSERERKSLTPERESERERKSERARENPKQIQDKRGGGGSERTSERKRERCHKRVRVSLGE